METRARHIWGHGICLALLAFALVILLTNVLPTRRHLTRVQRASEGLAMEIRALEAEQRHLVMEESALRTDPQHQIRVFRSTFKTPLPGEKLYRFPDDDLPGMDPAEHGEPR